MLQKKHLYAISSIFFIGACSFSNTLISGQKSELYFKYNKKEFYKHCFAEDCSLYPYGKKIASFCFGAPKIKKDMPYYTIAESSDKLHYFISPERIKVPNEAIKISKKNACLLSKSEYQKYVTEQRKREQALKEERIRNLNEGREKLKGTNLWYVYDNAFYGIKRYMKIKQATKTDNKCKNNYCKYKIEFSECLKRLEDNTLGECWIDAKSDYSINERLISGKNGKYYAVEDGGKIVFSSSIPSVEKASLRIKHGKQMEEAKAAAEKKQREQKIQEAIKNLPPSCQSIANLRQKLSNRPFGLYLKVTSIPENAESITVGEILASIIVDHKNVTVKCQKAQNNFDGSIYNTIGYATDGDDFRGVYFKERNGWVMCRGMYYADSQEENKDKCVSFFFGDLVRTIHEEYNF